MANRNVGWEEWRHQVEHTIEREGGMPNRRRVEAAQERGRKWRGGGAEARGERQQWRAGGVHRVIPHGMGLISGFISGLISVLISTAFLPPLVSSRPSLTSPV